MKKILGLDLGTTSIGWAFVNEAEKESEQSSIINTGVRIVPLTTDEEADFKKGNTISINADRTLKRGARRGLQRFKLRRDALIKIARENGFIESDYKYAEVGKFSTFSSYQIRAKAALEKITKEELVQVLLMLNKKRGYKSSRKAKTAEEGQAIDGMGIAKELFEKNLTPGQWAFDYLRNGGKTIPDFYRSDLQTELKKIVLFQAQFHPEIISERLLEDIKGKSRTTTSQHFTKTLKIELAENKGSREQTKLQHYKWRYHALKEQLSLKEIAFVLTEINNQINQSSGYLGAISDRSKELFFNNETVGQHLYKQLERNSNAKLKNQVFYRQDYLDEFEKIWETQAKHHTALTNDLKHQIRDITIFYQRRLKSQKHLISLCEFEKHHKAIPKSSPLFQEFRIWQNINSIVIKNIDTKEILLLDEELKKQLADELNYKDSFTDTQLMEFCKLKKKEHELNFKKIEGNRTNAAIYNAFESLLRLEGHNTLDFSTLNSNEVLKTTKEVFTDLGINTAILDFEAEIQGNDFDKQPYYQLWHLLYSSEDDDKLKNTLTDKFGFNEAQIPYLLNIELQADYGSLSAKAIKKILPHLKDGHKYDQACLLAGYNHSSSLTKEDNDKRILIDRLDIIKKNSLRNPVVEKIINQMVNVVNAIIDDPEMGKPDEIRVELARELKANNEQRSEMTKLINTSTKEHEDIRKLLSVEFGIKRVTRNDIIRYKLWKETDGISLYTGRTIEPSKLFTKEYDIEHIIPKSRLFDDSFSNKTLCERQFNIDKSNRTAFSYCGEKLNEFDFLQYEARVNDLFKSGKLKYTKYKKLLMADHEIPEDFIERQLRETQYIAKKAKEILLEVSRNVTSTIGSITDRLREDWELVEVMKELNWDKYHKLGLTREEEGKNGERLYKIIDWTKRNDHRHHAMDAITVAFTKPAYIQYLNSLNARDKNDKKGSIIYSIEAKHLRRDKNGKLQFIPPITNFRTEAKKHLENTLISYKAKNKVATKNKNTIKTKEGDLTKVQLTPRGQLHKETIYGKISQYATKEEKIGANFTVETIHKVAKKQYREALLIRLAEHGNDSKKAFTGKNALAKSPIYLDAEKTITIPEKVKLVWLEEKYTIRKDITPDNFKDTKNIDKVIDVKTKTILLNRFNEFNGDSKKAFGNLDENPIWLNQEKGINISKVSITGVSNVESLHTKKDNFGKEILDSNGKIIPVDFVSTGNNHHVAIYIDEKGNLKDKIVSFYEAVIRLNQGLPVIDRDYKSTEGWKFLFTLKQNEYFIFPNEETGFNPQEINLFNKDIYSRISPNLYRVQKLGELSTSGFWFRHHLETQINTQKELKGITYKLIQSSKNLEPIVKVRINHLGEIVQTGEY